MKIYQKLLKTSFQNWYTKQPLFDTSEFLADTIVFIYSVCYPCIRAHESDILSYPRQDVYDDLI